MANTGQEMTIDDLTSVYRVERKSKALSQVRRDLYPAMAALLAKIRADYEKQLAIDPDSLICEGINQRRKKSNQISKDIVDMRMDKVCSLALIGSKGGSNAVDAMTQEEREYYTSVLEISKRHNCILDRLSGKKRFEIPDIDSKPVHKEPVVPAVAKVEEPVAEDIVHAVEKDPKKPVQEPAVKEVHADIHEDIIPIDEEDQEMPEPDADDDIPEELVGKFFDAPKIEDPKTEEPAPDIVQESDDTIVIRILEDLPLFSGPERDYDLSKEDIVRMPKVMAEMLIEREKAVLVSPSL
jgi:DNA replication factor GINS